MDSCLEGDHDHFAALQEFELTNVDVNRAQIPQHVRAQPTLIIVSLSVRLSVCLSSFVQRLNALAALVRGELPLLHRNIITALITIDVHARDIVTDLIQQKVTRRRATHRPCLLDTFAAAQSVHNITEVLINILHPAQAAKISRKRAERCAQK